MEIGIRPAEHCLHRGVCPPLRRRLQPGRPQLPNEVCGVVGHERGVEEMLMSGGIGTFLSRTSTSKVPSALPMPWPSTTSTASSTSPPTTRIPPPLPSSTPLRSDSSHSAEHGQTPVLTYRDRPVVSRLSAASSPRPPSSARRLCSASRTISCSSWPVS